MPSVASLGLGIANEDGRDEGGQEEFEAGRVAERS